MRGVSIDITQRRQAEERFRLVVESAPSAMIMVSAQGTMMLVNAQTEAIFGYSRHELDGKAIEMLIPDPFRTSHPHHRATYFANATRRAMGAGRELFGLRKDGTEMPLEIGLTPIQTEQGMYVLASIIDITQRRQAEREAAQQRDELAHLSRVNMLGELSGSLAHELNQPLTAILSNAQAALRFLANKTADSDEVQEILRDIIDADHRAGETIHRLRLLFKKGEVTHQNIDVNLLVREVLKFLNSDLINNGVSASAELQPDLPMVRIDRVQMQQVLINLIMNACDAMSHLDGTPRELLLRTQLQPEGKVHLSLRDNGCGIPADHLAKVFEPFITTKPKGMGMGLAVCRTIVSAHGGKLWATNNTDAGATLHVTLPMANESAPDVTT
jgi:PAS domain S-box-containing protein